MSAPSLIPNQDLPTVAWKELQIGKLLGQGGFGKVYLGKWIGKEVAVKTLMIENIPAHLAAEFKNETKIMAECAQCEQIVKLFAVCMEVDHYAMVMEYVKKGSLFDVLHDAGVDLLWPTRYKMGSDIGKGLTYIHDKKILHRDLKSLNVLVDENMRAKISDFGLSKIKLETSKLSKINTNASSASAVGTLRWQAPELFELKPVHTKASDIYSYGMTLWEIATRQIPFSQANDVVVMVAVQAGKQEDFPEDCPEEYAKLIKRTWSLDLGGRPSAGEIVQELEKLLPKNELPSAYQMMFRGLFSTAAEARKSAEKLRTTY